MKRLVWISGALVLVTGVLYGVAWAADIAISQLGALTTPASGDLLAIVDVSDTTQSANGSTKKITYSDLMAGAASLPVADTTAVVKGSGDDTKLLRFEVDGFTTGNTRVMIWPNYDGTAATLAGTETLDNKTLTQPILIEAGGSPAVTLGDGSNTVGLALEGDRLFHDTDNDGTKDAGEEFIDQAGGAGGGAMPDKFYNWSGTGLEAHIPEGAPYDSIAGATELDLGTTHRWVLTLDDTADTGRVFVAQLPPELDAAGDVTFTVRGLTAATSGALQMFVAEGEYAAGEDANVTLATHAAASTTVAGTAYYGVTIQWTVSVATLGWTAADEVYCGPFRDGDGTFGTDSASGNFYLTTFSMSVPRGAP